MKSNLQQASLALERGQVGRADRLLEQLRITDTGNPKVWLLSASYYHQTGDRDSALHDLHTASTMALNDRSTRLQVLDACMNLQAWDQALQLLQQMDPQQQHYPLQYATCLWGAGEYQHSLQRWQQYARALPEVAEVQFRLWQSYERLGLVSDAEQQRARCQSWSGNHIGISMMELGHLVAEQQFADGWALLQRSFAEHGDTIQPLINAAVCLANWPEAADCRPAELDTERLLDQLNPNGQALLASQRWLLQNDLHRVYGNSTRMLQDQPLVVPDALMANGLVLEFGVFHGRSIRILADTLRNIGNASTVHGFDSFAGLPEVWNAEAAGSYSTQGRQPVVPDNVRLHAGWFNATLDDFLAQHEDPVALVHIDCDLYSSTRDVLQRLAPRLCAGSILVFDELLGYPGYEQHELRAFQELVSDWSGGYRIIGAAFMARAVAIQLSD